LLQLNPAPEEEAMSETESTSRISVTGDVLVTPRPDVAFISLFVSGEGILMEDAVREITTKLNQVNQTLRDTYKEIRDIHIHDVFVGENRPGMGLPTHKTNSPRPEVVKSLLVTAPPRPELAMKIIDTAIRMGCLMQNPAAFPGPPISQATIMYGLANPAEAQQEATARAIADAKEKAWRIAKMIERKLGRVKGVSATDYLNSDNMFRPNRNSVLARARYLSASADEVQISAKVSVTFELEE
jgi:uncharacterized protein YggE